MAGKSVDLSPRRILVVEDDPDSLANACLLLELEGYLADAASDGMAGLMMIHDHHPDLVISDIVMPRMDGLGLLAAVRASPVIAATPFLFLTGQTEYEQLRCAMNAGADDYLIKPYTPADLIGAVRTRLQRFAIPPPSVSSTAALDNDHLALLSAREQEIFMLIGQGLSSQQIADQLGLSRRTVDSHRAHILNKLGLAGPNELIRLAAVLTAKTSS